MIAGLAGGGRAVRWACFIAASWGPGAAAGASGATRPPEAGAELAAPDRPGLPEQPTRSSPAPAMSAALAARRPGPGRRRSAGAEENKRGGPDMPIGRPGRARGSIRAGHELA